MTIRFLRQAPPRRRGASFPSEAKEDGGAQRDPSSSPSRTTLVVSTLVALNLLLLSQTLGLARLAVVADVGDDRHKRIDEPTVLQYTAHRPPLPSIGGGGSSGGNVTKFKDGFDVQRMLETNDTAVLAQGPFIELQSFLRDCPDTPAARFVALLRQELHGRPGWEPDRFRACDSESDLPLCLGGLHNRAAREEDGRVAGEGTTTTTADHTANVGHATEGGNVASAVMNREAGKPYRRMGLNVTRAGGPNGDEGRSTYLPLLPTSEWTSVYQIQRHHRQDGTDRDYPIAKMDENINMACLPLFLAAASIRPTKGMVVELSPSAGFSSKCLAYGIVAALQSSPSSAAGDDHKKRRRLLEGTLTSNTATSRNFEEGIDGGAQAAGKISKVTPSAKKSLAVRGGPGRSRKYHRGATNLVAFGTFLGEKSLQAITKRAPWVKGVYPEITKDRPDFVQLWKDTVQAVYPAAKAVQGFVNAERLNDASLRREHGHPWQVLVLNNVLSSSQWHNRLYGLRSFKRGNILFFNDFQDRPEHVQMVYGCYRATYLMPVYISWNMKHMAFVVTQTFTSVHDAEFLQCYRQVGADRDRQTDVMKARLKQDLAFLAGLTMDPATHGLYGAMVETTTKRMFSMLDMDKAKNWNLKLALAGRFQR